MSQPFLIYDCCCVSDSDVLLYCAVGGARAEGEEEISVFEGEKRKTLMSWTLFRQPIAPARSSLGSLSRGSSFYRGHLRLMQRAVALRLLLDKESEGREQWE